MVDVTNGKTFFINEYDEALDKEQLKQLSEFASRHALDAELPLSQINNKTTTL